MDTARKVLHCNTPIVQYPQDMRPRHYSALQFKGDELNLLLGFECDVHVLREEYLYQRTVFRYNTRRVLYRGTYCAVGALWALVYVYGKLERAFDYFEYGLYIK